ncbi:MAG: hypothetical protein M1450_02425 [Patescibacteria group bacterium]|nr:hypothetical protein [Patescibacteria group bacterium]
MAQIKEYPGQGQIQSGDSYFYVSNGQATPTPKYPTPKPTCSLSYFLNLAGNKDS